MANGQKAQIKYELKIVKTLVRMITNVLVKIDFLFV